MNASSRRVEWRVTPAELCVIASGSCGTFLRTYFVFDLCQFQMRTVELAFVLAEYFL